ncbi:uncharacterized protein LOC114975714 isoform X2 [Acropora millepora]|nr:uncharacterized protein LOC114975714 isoform X2 [Acropora millepora]
MRKIKLRNGAAMKRLFTNIKMMSQNTVFLAALASVVSGQLCVPETLDCNEVLPTIYKMGHGSCACDSKAHDGALKYSNGKLFLCLNSEWKALRMTGVQEYGTELNPGSSCKDILEKADGKELSDGVYWIGIGLSESPLSTSFPVYCDMRSGGWTLVLKVVSYADQGLVKFGDVLDSTWPIQEYNMEALSITNQYKGHYKNQVFFDGNWESFNASEARVSLYESGNVVKELLFNAAASKYSNWFEKARLKSAPGWNNIWRHPQNYFNMYGYCGNLGPNQCRFFFINRHFGGCSVDKGWLMYTEHNVCHYESGSRHATVQYSKIDADGRWGNYFNHFRIADLLAVFLR